MSHLISLESYNGLGNHDVGWGGELIHPVALDPALGFQTVLGCRIPNDIYRLRNLFFVQL